MQRAPYTQWGLCLDLNLDPPSGATLSGVQCKKFNDDCNPFRGRFVNDELTGFSAWTEEGEETASSISLVLKLSSDGKILQGTATGSRCQGCVLDATLMKML